MIQSCAWPWRSESGAWCRTHGFWVPRFGRYLCAHHVGEADSNARRYGNVAWGRQYPPKP